MIQFNLLPDVKLAYIKAQRERRLIFVISFFVTAGAIALLVMLLLFNVVQKKQISDTSKNIQTESTKLKNEPQINKILTVQNQLESLTALHASKPAASQLFDYLNQVTPVEISISNFHIDFPTQTATITGSADALSTVNKYIDTLKFTTFSTDNAPIASSPKAFSNVVLTSFGLTNKQTTGPPASYTITLGYDPAIFDITQTAKLGVPNTITTRSALEQPTALFQASPNTQQNGSTTNRGAH
jgi:predicted phage tail protein